MSRETDQERITYPPDPNPRKASFDVPAGACDTHVHVFGPPHRFAYASVRNYTPPAVPVEHLMNMMDIVGLDRAVVVQPSAHGTDNAVTLNALSVGGGRFRGVIKVSGAETDAELERMHESGVRGVRYTFVAALRGKVDLALADRMGLRIAPMGWNTVLHMDRAFLTECHDWLDAQTMATVIDHFGRVEIGEGTAQPAFQALLRIMEKDNFWVKISGADRHSAAGFPWHDMLPFAHALIEAAPDRVIWGTDWPHSNIMRPGRTPNDGDLLDLMTAYAPDAAMRRKILVDNPARLYQFDG